LTGLDEVPLSAEEDVGTGAQFSPSKCVKEALISTETLGLFSALDFTQTSDF